MDINITRDTGGLQVALTGELDHHAARTVFAKLEVLEGALPRQCILDMSQVNFMDSSGIAVVLGLRRRVDYAGGRLAVRGVSPQAMRVFQAAGVDKLVDIQKL